MLYVFTGTSEYEVKNKTQNWKKLFEKKYWDFNLTHIKNFSEVPSDFISEALMSNSLFASKKLVIIDIDNSERKTSELEIKYHFLMGIISKISDDTILLFSFPKPDKRSKFYKTIIKLAQKVEIYDEKKWYDLEQEISGKYSWKISRWAITMLVRYKSWSYEKVVREIEKLSILYPFIDTKEIERNIMPELEESIFVLIDSILNKNKKWVFKNLKIISEDINFYLLYNSLLANIRTTFYIGLLKIKKIPSFTIKNELKLRNRWFLADKKYAMKNEDIWKLYTELIWLDKKMKTGNMIGSEEKDFLFELEQVLIRYIK